MADVVDLALSDDDADISNHAVQEADLDDDLVILGSPGAETGGTGAPASVTRAARRNGSGVDGGGTSAGPGVMLCESPLSRKDSSSRSQKRAKRTALTTGGERAQLTAAANNAVIIDDDPVVLGGDGNEGGTKTRRDACSACTEGEGRSLFILERCGHELCPTCIITKVPAPVAPVCPACGKAVSVRDLALILEENAWCELQTKRVAAFRERASTGNRCPSCQAWVPSQSSLAHQQWPRRGAEDVEVCGVDRIGGGSNGGGTARERVKKLLSTPPLVCLQGHYLCQFCGLKLTKEAPVCGCGDSKLLAFSGLLSLLEELVANPASVELCGPVGPLPALAAGRGRGSKRGTGRGSHAYYAGARGNSGISSKWTKGTGYGGSGDAAAAASAQAAAAEAEKRADRTMVVVLDALASCLPARGDSPEHLPELLALVRESSLLQLVCRYLRNDSLMDIAKRRELYKSLFNLVQAFALHELLAPLIDHVPPKGVSSGGGGGGRGDGSISSNAANDGGDRKGKGKRRGSTEGTTASGFSGAGAAADLAMGTSEDVEEDAEEEDEDVSVADLLEKVNRQAKVFSKAPGAGDGKSGDAGTLAFALQVIEVYEKVKASLTYLRGLAEARAASPAALALASAMGAGGVAGAGLGRKRKREAADIVEVSLESRYLAELGDSRFKLVQLLGGGRSHHFSAEASKRKGGAGGRARAVRIHQEVSTLATSLPVQPDSSIFLRVDEDRFDVMRAMITGPKGTPYEGGCFEFDILLPLDYPNKPPRVQFLTTGNGRVRFNPNLYSNGKVCLSLLGTWAGPGWNAKTSTLLQVLISIQSLIFVSEPYFNEPGFEGQLGTPQGRSASWSYNRRIRNGTLLFGIVDALEKGRSGALADVKTRHFRLMKGQIMQTARSWLNDMALGNGDSSFYSAGQSSAGCAGDYSSMAALVAKIEKLMSPL